MRYYFIVLIAALPLFVFGIDTTKSNHLYVSGMAQYNFNKWNVNNSSDLPNLIQAKNSIGQSVSIGYRRITKYGLIMMVGVGVSRREHDISIVRNIKEFDPASITNEIITTNLKLEMQSIDPELMLGYSKSINKNHSITFKAGVVQKRFVTKERSGAGVLYFFPDTGNVYTGEFIYLYEVNIGKPSRPNGGFEKVISYNLLPQFAIGIERSYNKQYIKYLSVDLNMILLKQLFRAHFQEVEVLAGKNKNSTTPSVSTYIDRFASVGLKVSIGFWR
ncbi:MAG: hypothetical protein JNM41_12785 [Flavipsychrobacter sp.]|nr:hypothetical protein [Flavipsychrobacter sp.]